MQYKHLGWHQRGAHDMVWGVIQLGEADDPELHRFMEATGWTHKPRWWNNTYTYVTFWGRRGIQLHTKLWAGTPGDAKSLFLKKLEMGYLSIEPDQLHQVCPEFRQDIEKVVLWATLKT